MVSGPRISAFWCPKDTYFTSFSRLRSAFEKSTYFTVLSRLCMACANGANRPEGRFSPTRWSLFRSEREAEHIFFDPLRSYFHRKIQWFSQFFAEVEDRFGKLVKYVPLGHQRALWGRFFPLLGLDFESKMSARFTNKSAKNESQLSPNVSQISKNGAPEHIERDHGSK